MAQVTVYNLEGAETGSIELPDAIFGEQANSALLYQAIRVAQANARKPLAQAKDRSDVRGGGKKPWRQKGTGRARHGSSRSPIWKGGGVTFGPQIESITKLSLPSKMRRKAIRAALSERVRENKLIVVSGLASLEKPSTKSLSAFLKHFKLATRKVLFLSDEGMEHAILSVRNVPSAKSIRLENINILDLLSHGTVVMDKDSVEKLTAQLS